MSEIRKGYIEMDATHEEFNSNMERRAQRAFAYGEGTNRISCVPGEFWMDDEGGVDVARNVTVGYNIVMS